MRTNALKLIFTASCLFGSASSFAATDQLSLDYMQKNYTLIHGNDFEQKSHDFTKIQYSKEVDAFGYHSTARSGSKAVRFSLRRTDPIVSSSLRSELSASSSDLKIVSSSLSSELSANSSDLKVEGIHYYRFSIYIPKGQKIDQNAGIVAQWHGTPDRHLSPPESYRSPSLALIIENNQFVVNQLSSAKLVTPDSSYRTEDRYDHSERTVVHKMEQGKWYDWIFEVRWDYRDGGSSEAMTKAYLNGGKVYDSDNGNAFKDVKPGYFKFGIYRWDWARNKGDLSVDRQDTYYDDVYHFRYKKPVKPVTPEEEDKDAVALKNIYDQSNPFEHEQENFPSQGALCVNINGDGSFPVESSENIIDQWDKNRRGIFLRMKSGTSQLQVAFQNPGTGYVFQKTFSLEDNVNNLVCVNWNDVTKKGQIFLNGELIESRGYINSTNWVPDEQLIDFGSSFAGLSSELFLFNRNITAQQIELLQSNPLSAEDVKSKSLYDEVNPSNIEGVNFPSAGSLCVNINGDGTFPALYRENILDTWNSKRKSIFLRMKQDSSKLQVAFQNPGTEYIFHELIDLRDNTDNYVCATWDNINKEGQVFLNGVLVSSKKYLHNVSWVPSGQEINLASSFSGVAKDLVVFDKVISDLELDLLSEPFSLAGLRKKSVYDAEDPSSSEGENFPSEGSMCLTIDGDGTFPASSSSTENIVNVWSVDRRGILLRMRKGTSILQVAFQNPGTNYVFHQFVELEDNTSNLVCVNWSDSKKVGQVYLNAELVSEQGYRFNSEWKPDGQLLNLGSTFNGKAESLYIFKEELTLSQMDLLVKQATCGCPSEPVL